MRLRVATVLLLCLTVGWLAASAPVRVASSVLTPSAGKACGCCGAVSDSPDAVCTKACCRMKSGREAAANAPRKSEAPAKPGSQPKKDHGCDCSRFSKVSASADAQASAVFSFAADAPLAGWSPDPSARTAHLLASSTHYARGPPPA